MAWNQSRIENGKRRIESDGKSSILNLRFTAAVVVILAVTGVGAWLFWPSAERGDKAVAVTKKPGQIREVRPAPAPKAEEPVPEAPKPVDPNARPTKVGEIVNGYIKLPSGRIHKRVGVITNTASAMAKLPCEIFTHHCDNEIACYLWIEPGTEIVDMPNYGGRFTKEFLESLKEPIVITKDDTPEQAQLKRAVNEAKIELKAAYDRGEDIEKIVYDTRDELRKLGLYKQEIRQQLLEYRQKENVSDEDVQDFLTACNQLLEQKGIAPLKVGPLSRRNLKRVNKEKLK